jgi:thiosulfate/3-mercaptopyruvate sulfurtransferase
MTVRPTSRTGAAGTAIGPTRRRLLGLAAGAAGLATLPAPAGRGETIAPVPAATVPAFAGNGDPPLLVEAAWLRSRIEAAAAERPRVVDLSPLRSYRAGHVPGAVHGWWQDTIAPDADVYGVVFTSDAEPFTRADVLEDLGIGDGTTVVCYDDDRNRRAAHLVWYLRYLGHDAASVLDGGLAAWSGAGGAVDDGERAAPAADPATIRPRTEFIIDTSELSVRLDDPILAILDARTDDEATDDLNGTLAIGRIPGSIRVPWTATVRDEAGRLRPPDELAALFAGSGITPEREIAIVARFGVEAGQPWLVLNLLGYPSVRVYDRGWAGWVATPGAPVEPLAPGG